MNLTREEVLAQVQEVGVCLPSDPAECDELLDELVAIDIIRQHGQDYHLEKGRLEAWCVECRLANRVLTFLSVPSLLP